LDAVTIAYANATGITIYVQSVANVLGAGNTNTIADVKPSLLTTFQTLIAVRLGLSAAAAVDPSSTLRGLFSATGAVLNRLMNGNGDRRTEDWFVRRAGWGGVFDLNGASTASSSSTDPASISRPISSVASTYSVPLGVTSSAVLGNAVVAAIRTSLEICIPGDDQDVPSTRMRVKNQDTLQTIAAQYNYNWQTLLLLNPGLRNPNQLVAKNILYHSLLYVVRAGDTVYSIAQKYGITWKQLVDQNPQIPQVKAKLDWREIPSGECFEGQCYSYYYNLQTKQVQWDKPDEVLQAELTDNKIYVGEKLAVRPNLELLVCKNQYYKASAVHTFPTPGQ